MADVFRHAWWAFAQVYYDLRALAIRGNLWWFVTVFPLFPIVGIPLASALQQAMVGIDGPVTGIVFFVFIVAGTALGGALAGPGTAGLFYVAQLHVDGEDITTRDFLDGISKAICSRMGSFCNRYLLAVRLGRGICFLYWNRRDVYSGAWHSVALFHSALGSCTGVPLPASIAIRNVVVSRVSECGGLSAQCSSLISCFLFDCGHEPDCEHASRLSVDGRSGCDVGAGFDSND